MKIFSLAGLIEVERVAIKMGEHVLFEQLLVAVQGELLTAHGTHLPVALHMLLELRLVVIRREDDLTQRTALLQLLAAGEEKKVNAWENGNYNFVGRGKEKTTENSQGEWKTVHVCLLCVISCFDDVGEPRERGSKTASVCWATWVAHTANSATNTTPAELNMTALFVWYFLRVSVCYLVSKQNGICPSLRKWVGGSLTVAWLLVCCRESTKVREHSLPLLPLSASSLMSTIQIRTTIPQLSAVFGGKLNKPQ